MRKFYTHSNTRKADPLQAYKQYGTIEKWEIPLNEWTEGTEPNDYWVIKKVSDTSKKHLQDERYNPVHVHLLTTFLLGNECLHVCIYSPHLNTYNVFLDGNSTEQRFEWLNKVKDYITSQEILNGDSLVAFCKELDKECEIQYN